MYIEITSARIDGHTIKIEAIDISEENLQKFERVRDDGIPTTLLFEFDTEQTKPRLYAKSWLHNQKACKDAKTYGEAVQAVVGTITTISKKYRVWD